MLTNIVATGLLPSVGIRRRKVVRRTATLFITCLLVACRPAGTPETQTRVVPPAARVVVPAKLPTPAGATLTGTVVLPAKVISNNGGNIIAVGSGNIIGAGAGNIIGAGAGNIIGAGAGNFNPDQGGIYRLAATSDAPLAGAAVTLVDRERRPIPGMPTTVTDAAGHYTLVGVPPGLTALVVVGARTTDGKDAHLEALATVNGPAADVGLASTMVSEAVGATAPADPTSVREAVTLTAAALTDESVPDLADRHGLVTSLDTLAANSPALAAALSRARGIVATPTPAPPPTPTPAPGTIETVLEVANPSAFAIGADGAFYYAAANTLVRATEAAGPVTLASLVGAVGGVRGIALGSAGEVLVGDGAGSRIMKLVGTGFVVAAGSTPGFAGDGGPWADALFQNPRRIAPDGAGGYLVADGTRRVRQLRRDGTVATIAGDGTAGVPTGTMGDGGPALAAQLAAPNGLAVLGGDFYIADATANRVRRMRPDGTITTFAGNGQGTSTGDGGPATAASLAQPTDLATDGTNLFILESLSSRVRKVDAAGKIATYAGTTADETVAGDGGPATAAKLGEVRAIAVDPTGRLCILGTEAIRRVR